MSPERERRFAAALLNPDRPAPDGLSAPNGDAARRFNVYRNNVVVGLVDALRATYPAVAALVGERFFEAVAREYARAEPPLTPILIAWGGGFGDFLAAFPPAARLPYLPDVARLEWARAEAYNAADAAPLEIAALAEIAPDALGAIRIRPHPSLRLIASAHPAVSLWAESTGRAGRTDLDLSRAETALVVRPAMRVETSIVPRPTARFLGALAAGETLAEAAGRAAAEDDFDLAGALGGLFSAGLVAELVTAGAATAAA